jgi:hypothetical protein
MRDFGLLIRYLATRISSINSKTTYSLLAEELRGILFPYRGGLFTGTYSDPDKLYQSMIDAFEGAIAKWKD